MSAVDLLLAAAPAFGIEGTRSGDGTARVTLPAVRPSGASGSYQLELQEMRDDHVRVREAPQARRLPAQCPERHINAEGWFCLYWREGEGEARPVKDADSAADWWTLLNSYLIRQETVSTLRRWVGEARAHGDAARHQRVAERIAATFGAKFAQHLRDAALRVARRQRHGRALFQLSRGDALIARLSTSSTGQIAPDVVCPCDDAAASARPIGACGSHRSDLKEFILALHQWHQAERRFYEYLRAARVRCCGTMRDCPLRAGAVGWA